MSRKVAMNLRGTVHNEIDKQAKEALKTYMQFFNNDYSFIIDTFYGQMHSKL